MSFLRAFSLVVGLLSAPAFAQEFPQVFEHKFGTTTLEAKPERIVTLSYSGIDHYLALGVIPVGVREWYGDYPNGAWPWAQDALGDASIIQIPEEYTYEQIAALEPDVIEGLTAGMTAAQYAELSKIAPVVATEEQYGDFGTPWFVQTQTMGRIAGKAAEAKVLVEGINGRFADIVAAHPQWQGMTASVAFADVKPGAFRSDDIRPMTLSQLGFVTPQAIDDAESEYGFYTEFSPEDLSLIDTDLLVWVSGDDDTARIKALTMRNRLKAHLEGREIVADKMLAGAFSYASPLSLGYLLDRMVPEIELAVDGDPATVVPSAEAGGLTP